MSATLNQEVINTRTREEISIIDTLLNTLENRMKDAAKRLKNEFVIEFHDDEYTVLTSGSVGSSYFYDRMAKEGFPADCISIEKCVLTVKLGTEKITLMDRVVAGAAIGDCPSLRDIVTNNLFNRAKAIIELKLLHRKESSAIIRISDDEKLLLESLVDSENFYAKMEEEGFSDEHITFSGNYIEISI